MHVDMEIFPQGNLTDIAPNIGIHNITCVHIHHVHGTEAPSGNSTSRLLLVVHVFFKPCKEEGPSGKTKRLTFAKYIY